MLTEAGMKKVNFSGGEPFLIKGGNNKRNEHRQNISKSGFNLMEAGPWAWYQGSYSIVNLFVA